MSEAPLSVLVTGASGFLGRRLVARLAGDHHVLALSRADWVPDLAAGGMARPPTMITGSYADPADLAQLDDHPIDVVVHLAAVTGGCTLTSGLAVNVSGTQALLDYGIARGITRFVLASSIAAIGCLSPEFLPQRLPIDDDHECVPVDPYGFSKAMVEQLAFFVARVHPEIDLTVLRIGSVQPENTSPPDAQTLEQMTLPFTALGTIEAVDAVAALAATVEHPAGPGVRRVNLVGRTARSPIPTGDTLRTVLGERADRLDLTHFDQPGHEHDSVYAVDRLAQLFGCHPR